MPSQVLSEDEKAKLTELEMKSALGGVDKSEEEELFALRKKKKLQQTIDKNRIE